MKTQQRAAMRCALEALEEAHTVIEHRQDVRKREEAITALREALAQPQGEWVDLTDDDISDTYAIWWRQKHVFGSFTHAAIAKFKEKNTPPVVQQGEWQDLTVDEIAKALNTADSHNTIDSYRAVIAAFKEKNRLVQREQQASWKHTCNALCVDDLELWVDQCPHCGKPRSTAHPAQREQQEPVGYLVYSLDGVSFQDSYCEGAEPVYTPPPSVEAAIEATKEKAAKVCEEIMEYGEYPDCEAEQCAAAIRGLK